MAAAGQAPVTADVLVVGGGAAGLAAAVSAAERGMAVVVADRAARVGGTTGFSVGSVTGACTPLQRRAGIGDSADAFVEDMAAFAKDAAGEDNPALRRLLAAESGPTISWLMRLGVRFVGPFEEPPNRVARMHNAVPGSRAYVDRLSRACRRLGVRVWCDTAVTHLRRDPAGRVTGATCRHRGGERVVHARRGVILAAGDFAGNDELRRRWLDGAAVDALPVNPASSGDGQLLAAGAGASLRNLDLVFGPQLRFPAPPSEGLLGRLPTSPPLTGAMAQFVQRAPAPLVRMFATQVLVSHLGPSPALQRAAVLVNVRGETVRSDDGEVAARLVGQPGRAGYLILDRELAEQFDRSPNYISTVPSVAYAYAKDYRRGRPDLVHEAGDAVGLAAAIGADPDTLARSLAGADRQLEPPLVALGPLRAMLTVTEGGALVDPACRVLTEDGDVIPGLLAAGGNGQGGLRLLGHGLHLAWAFTSGRVAGETAARSVPATESDDRHSTRA